ncbi:MAG: hypothetical protein KY456_13880 [Chloroflexi bacterium]|nr:hypothetical protein [Chloroflexota bacterium]
MDTTKFDSVTRLFGSGMTRREALRGLVAGAAVLTAGSALLQAEDASARRRRRKSRKNGKQNQNQNPNGHQDSTCGVHGDGCGALDADTGEFTPPYCCHGYACTYNNSNGSTTWTCQAVP